MARLLESGDVRLLESGDARLLEGEGGVIPPTPSTSTLFDDSKGFPSEEYENAIDRITFMMQELEGSLCDCRDDPSVVVCVALLSSTGIYNTELQGGGEPDPVFGETLTLGVGVSGTGPYTYQWKVGGVDAVGATSLTFDYVVASSNASITVQVTNECSTLLVGPYLIEFCEGYDCDALAETGRVVAEAYWPMTDPMVISPVATHYFHAGDTYGPYDAGDTANGWGLYYTFGFVNADEDATITFDKFNYCETETANYKHHYSEWDSYFGYAAMRLMWQEAQFSPAGPNFSTSVTYALRENTYLSLLAAVVGYRITRVAGGGQPGDPTDDTYEARGNIKVDSTTLECIVSGPSGGPSEVINHTMDITKPYVVTVSLAMTIGTGTRSWTENATVVWDISQGDLNYQSTLNITVTLDNAPWQNDITGVEGRISSVALVDLANSGAQQYIMGIAYGGDNAHAEILDGLNRNYEGYECP